MRSQGRGGRGGFKRFLNIRGVPPESGIPLVTKPRVELEEGKARGEQNKE